MDSATKAQIISRLILKTTSFIRETVSFDTIAIFYTHLDFRFLHTNQPSNLIEQPEGGCETGEDSLAKKVSDLLVLWTYLISWKLPASVPPPQRLTTPSTRDFFQSEISSTSFPACYPPPPGEPSFSPRKTLVTQFKLTPSAKNGKLIANRSADVPSMTAVFGKMSVTTPGTALKTHENHKCPWASSFKTSEAPLPLSPVAASMSGLPLRLVSVELPRFRSVTPRRLRLPCQETHHIPLPLIYRFCALPP